MSGDNPHRNTIEHLLELANLVGQGASAEERAVGADMFDELGMEITAAMCRHKTGGRHMPKHAALLKMYAMAKDNERRASLRNYADSYGIAKNAEITRYIDATIPLQE